MFRRVAIDLYLWFDSVGDLMASRCQLLRQPGCSKRRRVATDRVRLQCRVSQTLRDAPASVQNPTPLPNEFACKCIRVAIDWRFWAPATVAMAATSLERGAAKKSSSRGAVGNRTRHSTATIPSFCEHKPPTTPKMETPSITTRGGWGSSRCSPTSGDSTPSPNDVLAESAVGYP
jgi:hypothetical protein